MSQDDQKNRFEDYSKESRDSILSEFWYFLKYNKKWWLLPIILVLIAMGALVILGSSGLAPFIYPLF